MRSPLGALATLANKAPVPYIGRGNSGMAWHRPAGTEQQMRAMGSVGTLFAIIDRLATSTAAPAWKLYRAAKPGQRPEDREEVTRHLALDIWNRPSNFFTQSLFVETFQQYFDLVGEAYWIVSRNPHANIPLELWPVRPDRMLPIPDRDNYLAGWIYRSPDGEEIPLRLDEVIQLRRPNPVDAYRGIGPVQTILADIDGARLSAEWNRNFFYNSAEPGGIVQYDRRLDDNEYEELVTRWREQHQGVANAHRVAIIEGGQWVDRAFSQRDMQFVELRGVSREVIREAFGIPKFAVGDVEDINRATAEAAKTWFAEQMTVPRLERIKRALNTHFLPLFGTTGVGVEFDYESPVTSDREADDRERDSKTASFKVLVEAGVDHDDAADTVGLPRMRVVTPLPAPAPAVVKAVAARLDHHHPARLQLRAREGEQEEDPALPGVREDLEEALDRLLNDWAPLVDDQINTLVSQVQTAIDASDVASLSGIAVDAAESAALLRIALGSMAQTAAERMAGECAAQGVDVTAPRVDEALTAVLPGRMTAFGVELADIAVTVAEMLAGDLAMAAGREALRLYGPGGDGAQIAAKVRSYLSELKGALRRSQLGAALHRATNVGRAATLKAAFKVRPGATIVAIEENDQSTCGPCKNLDGYEFEDLAEANAIYGPGGYYACDGRDRCRGTFKAVWD